MTKIQKVREEKGVSIYRLSKLTGMKITTISNIEKGITDLDKVQLGTLKKIAKALEVPVIEIIE